MANTRKRGLARRAGSRGELNREQGIELLIGPGGESDFTSEAEVRQAWRERREELLATIPPFRRPWAWWEYEAPGPLLWINEPEENYLERHGLLTAQEKTMLARSRREGDIPPRPITRKPANPLFRYFRYGDESNEEFAARLRGEKTRWA